MLCAFWAYFCLPDSIETCKFLTVDERKILRSRLVRASPARDHIHDASQKIKSIRGHLSKFLDREEAVKALRDPLPWMNAIMLFCLNVSYSSIPVFLPQILAESGFKSIRAQGLTAPPYLAAFFVSLAGLWFSDRVQRRGPFAIALFGLGSLGYALLTRLTGPWARYGMTFIILISLFTLIPVLYMWLLNNQPSSSRKGGECHICRWPFWMCIADVGKSCLPHSSGTHHLVRTVPSI